MTLELTRISGEDNLLRLGLISAEELANSEPENWCWIGAVDLHQEERRIAFLQAGLDQDLKRMNEYQDIADDSIYAILSKEKQGGRWRIRIIENIGKNQKIIRSSVLESAEIGIREETVSNCAPIQELSWSAIVRRMFSLRS